MTAAIAVGTVRTYAHIAPQAEFTYETWKEAIRRGETFVTFGPLLEFQVDGHPMGSRIGLSASGGTVNIEWKVSSVTIPVSRLDLVVNGEIQESVAAPAGGASGFWSLKIDRELLGCYACARALRRSARGHRSPLFTSHDPG